MHKFYHGDWFAGKLVGLAQIKYHTLLLNVYTTHVSTQIYLRINLLKKICIGRLNFLEFQKKTHGRMSIFVTREYYTCSKIQKKLSLDCDFFENKKISNS